MEKTIWQKVQAVLGVICIIVYAAATIYAVLLIYGAVREHTSIAEREYNDLKELAASAGVLGWQTESFKDDIRDAVAVSKTLQAVIITGSGDYAVAVEKAPNTVVWSGTIPHFSNSFYLLRRLQPGILRIDGQRNLEIGALSTYIDFYYLLYILRKALLSILVAVLLSFSMLIADICRSKNVSVVKTDTGDDENIITEVKSEESESNDRIVENEIHEEPVKNENPFNESAIDTDDVYLEDDPFGVFNDERTFSEQFAPELQNAEENDRDIVLVSTAWTSQDMSYTLLAEEASRCFKNGSRIFEKNIPGLYIIIPDSSIDEAFESAKRFHRSAVDAIKPEVSGLLVGLSSRAGRSVHSERLISEAERAHGKAGEDPASPIVAFKVDLEKYNAFIAKNNN